MEQLIFTYEDTEQLESVVENNYFINGDMGKKGSNAEDLSVDSESMLYNILNNIKEPKIRIKNNKILGTLTCDIVSYNGSFTLRPIPNICIKENKKYSFY